jgi:site-specific DNA recombinase
MATPSVPLSAKRAAIYCRVSGSKQKEGYSLLEQETSGRAYAERCGMAVVEVFEEVFTSTTLDRPKFGRLLDLAERGVIDVVIVAVSDRLGRGSRLEDALDVLRDAGCEVHHVTRGNISDDDDDAVYTMNQAEGFVSGIERRNIVRRFKVGVLTKINTTGKTINAGTPPYGYKFVGEGKKREMVRDEATASIVEMIFTLYADGIGVNNICRLLAEKRIPVPSRSVRAVVPQAPGRSPFQWQTQTIYRMLRRRAYMGEHEAFKPNWAHKKGAADRKRKVQKPLMPEPITLGCPAIVDGALFERVQRRLDTGREVSPRNNKKHTYLLRSMVYCACGRRMTTTSKNGALAYRCNSTTVKKFARNVEEVCASGARKYLVSAADAAVWHWIETEVLTEDNIRKAIERTEGAASGIREKLLLKRNRYQQRLDANRATLERLKQAVFSGVFTAHDVAVDKQRVDEEHAELLADIADCDAELASLSMTPQTHAAILAEARRLKAKAKNAQAKEETVEHRRSILEDLKTHVTLYRRDTVPWAHIEVRFTVEPYQQTDVPLEVGDDGNENFVSPASRGLRHKNPLVFTLSVDVALAV